MDFIYHILLKELYAVFGNLIIVFLLCPFTAECERQFFSMNSIKTLLSIHLARKIYVIWSLLHVMARYRKNFFQAYWKVAGNGGLQLNGTRKKWLNVLMKIKTSKCSVADWVTCKYVEEESPYNIYKNKSCQ